MGVGQLLTWMRGGELSQAWVGVHACQQIDHLLVDLNPIVHKVLR